MPAAGFYPIESHSIRFGRDGQWYADGERIDNPRIARLFSRCVRRRPDGGFMLEMGEERAPLEVEDTPFVVREVDGDPEQGFWIVLNDDTREPLDPATLRIAPDNALVCRAKGGAFEARFLRPAYYQLARWAVTTPAGDFVLRAAGREHAIGPR